MNTSLYFGSIFAVLLGPLLFPLTIHSLLNECNGVYDATLMQSKVIDAEKNLCVALVNVEVPVYEAQETRLYTRNALTPLFDCALRSERMLVSMNSGGFEQVCIRVINPCQGAYESEKNALTSTKMVRALGIEPTVFTFVMSFVGLVFWIQAYKDMRQLQE